MAKITWTPGIGDPTAMGWITVLLYLITAALSFLVMRRRATIFGDQRAHEAQLWMMLAVVLLLLGINKQLDLQSLLTDIGRVLFREYGFYEQRRYFQQGFIAALLLLSVTLLLTMGWYFRHSLRDNGIAILGLGVLLTFVAIRASSFHHMDRFIGVELVGVRMNWIMEIGAISLIGFNAVRLLLRVRESPATPW